MRRLLTVERYIGFQLCNYESQKVTYMKEPVVKASDFLGLSKKKAQDKAEAKSLIFRLIRVGEEHFFPYPDDVRTDRLCVEIDNLIVTKASIQ